MIIYACSDLLFATRITSAADQAQVANQPARTKEKLLEKIESLNDREPVTILIDLEMDSAIELVQTARCHQANAHIVAFGSHVNKQRFIEAKESGADQALPRSVFVAKLSELIREADRQHH